MSFDLPALKEKDIVVVGQGKEWLSFEKFVAKNIAVRSIKNVFITDDNRAEVGTWLETLDLNNTVVVKTAGYAGRHLPVPYTTPTQIFFECVKQLKAKTIGVTGTKGKTTTATLLQAVLHAGGLDARLCGNVGFPMLDALDNANQNTIFVIELSSYQLTELQQSPNIAIITNLYKDHVDYHEGLGSYWEAKRNIMRFMDENGQVIYHQQNKIVRDWLAQGKATGITIDPNKKIDMSKAKLIGEHNMQNFMLVQAAAELMGIDHQTIIESFNSFEPVRHRLQPVRKVKGITFIDDAIGSTPEATIAGINALTNNIGPVGCVMLGGLDRDYDYSQLVKLISKLSVPKLILFPETGAKIKAILPQSYTPETYETTDMTDAVNWAAKSTPKGTICLLSTAAPSTVLWSSFEEKGDLFQQAVMDLSE